MSGYKVLGQERTAKILGRFLKTKNIPSALLFSGPSGIGKAMVARQFTQALLCSRRDLESSSGCGACEECVAIDKGNHPDVLQVNVEFQVTLLDKDVNPHAKTLHVKTMRHILSRMGMEALRGGWKVAIFEDELDLEAASTNALLKMLEEPLPRTLWILVSARALRLPKTVLSRCLEIPCARIKNSEIVRILEERGLAPGRARLLAELAEGAPGRALELDGVVDSLAGLISDPAAAATAAEALPKELALARLEVRRLLWGLTQNLRPPEGPVSPRFGRFAAAMREFNWLRQALEANADPRVILSLAVDAAHAARP